MLRLALILAAATFALPAQAQESEILRLACRAADPALSPPLTFSINVTAKDAVEVASGTHYGVTVYRDGLGLFDPAQGPSATVYRIDRVSGRFARVDLPARWNGRCDPVTP
ncbi:hypothetical protein [Magnetospirillum sulfuroxidans]|uniref:C-type lysozyme inhibitor domain-containing protein n=1 Tax=Magnetospirillum sulfuroxidans TaxID=611300 RepID=A0ABS5IG22_9PROT|nr:hypothetical protein [Magnetospirillum sulfuroxidans]MBR9973376.1 hypothetical protein [Magnetospirillum sulfuroxidans]